MSTDKLVLCATDGEAAELVSGVITSAEPGLTDDELAELSAVVDYLQGDDDA
ncbi:hypothetical protein SAMN05216226_10810 [Halovenus aranensis]|uniref:Uncharacterized protein n=1 Tax=Halovenus aranensis TaxID=890420 RepID=A0A1G8W0M2_9EURY|nr:hypothetical protein [Halovenus aranensis]SDJ71914.1 hypothetical protein SAMN05216226_10810 [Halovenus aranensis]